MVYITATSLFHATQKQTKYIYKKNDEIKQKNRVIFNGKLLIHWILYSKPFPFF